MIARDTLIHAVVLGGFCLAAAGLLSTANQLTSDEIQKRSLEDLQASLGQVIPPSLHDNNPAADVMTIPGPNGTPLTVYRATRSGAVVGVAYEVEGPGYASPIKLILGIGSDGRVLGVRVLKHNETPGLGDKIEPAKSDWITRFAGKMLGDPPEARWKVKKDGGEFDQFAGATITPRSVVGAIREGLVFFGSHKGQLLAAAPAASGTETR